MDNLDVKEWMRFAQNDYDCAVILKDRFRPPIENVCYLCQQSAEKILKAYTIAKANTLIKTHDIEDLLDVCKQHSLDFDCLADSCLTLTPYVALGRYPSNIEIVDYDMRQALKSALDILEFTKSKLTEMGFEAT
jgi:HEPN domain-containing protein